MAQLVHRVVDTIADWGSKGSISGLTEDGENFRNELAHLMLTQKACFNSPVWFNVGVKEARGYGWYWDEPTDTIKKLQAGANRPQCSACFIVSVKDSLESILDLAKTEGMLFKWGSGTGTNLSALREEDAILSGGGRASGPLSFMKGFDAFAGVIKSRRQDAPRGKDGDPELRSSGYREFHLVQSEGRKEGAHAHRRRLRLVARRRRVQLDLLPECEQQHSRDGRVHARGCGRCRLLDQIASERTKPVERYKARDLMRQIAEATWQCGDPGMQFDTTVNRWHTCKTTARINASNPCSEYMFLDDSACNLASLNLMKFVGPDGQFDVEAFRHAVDTVITAQEIIVDNASYPTEKIAQQLARLSSAWVWVIANLGALLMSMGLPYDSDQGRDFSGAITAVMCGQSYLTSARIAGGDRTLPGLSPSTKHSFLEVIRMHRDSVNNIDSRRVPPALFEAALECWNLTPMSKGKFSGYRNAQTTVLAPTGTIGFMMDCDTTGIEPDLALVKYKKLVGGGVIKIVNQTVPQALIKLGYTPDRWSRSSRTSMRRARSRERRI